MSRDRLIFLTLSVILTIVPAATAVAQSSEPAFCHPGVRRLLTGDLEGAMRDLAPSPGGAGGNDPANARAIARLINGDDAEALAELDKALAENPSSPLLRYNRGMALLTLGQWDRAAADFETVMADESSELNARAAYHRALVDVHHSRLSDAERHIRLALVLDPLLPDARVLLGWILERQRRWAEAGQEYKLFLADYPETTWAMLRFGVVALRAGFPETARTWLRRATESDPSSNEAVEARKYLVMLE